MNPLTIDQPTPGIHVTRTRIEPQPPAEWNPIAVEFYEVWDHDAEGQEIRGTGRIVYGAYNEDWGCEAPHAPGEYWVRERTWASDCGKYLAVGFSEHTCDVYCLETQTCWPYLEGFVGERPPPRM